MSGEALASHGHGVETARARMPARPPWSSRSAALAPLLAVVLAGCGGKTEPAHPVAVPPPSAAGIERIIPIRFVEMVPSCAGPCKLQYASRETLEKRVLEANAVFYAAGIQFVVGSAEAYPMPSFSDLMEDATKHPDGNRERTWAEIQPEIALALPAAAACVPGRCPFQPTTRHKERRWLIEAAIYFSPPQEVLVWVADHNNGSQGQLPWEGRSITTHHGDLTYFNFAHEIGHFLGLPHTFQGPYSSDLNPRSTMDPSTGRPIRMSDFWDLVYTPSNPPRFYRSREEAARDEKTLESIDRVTPGARCATTNDEACNTVCQVPFGSQPGVLRTGDPVMDGLAPRFHGDTPATPRRGFNVMSYFGSSKCAGFAITATQVAQIRKALTFDMPLAGHPGMTGGRPYLGRQTPPPR
jgi:hypothetical protein